MMTFKKVTPEEAGLTNYCAYVANCQPLDFRKDGKEIRVYPAGTQDQESGYIQCGTPEYINGWLYGAVQTINDQVRPQNPEPAGILVSVALHDNESAPDGVTFLYTKEDWIHLDAERIKADFTKVLHEAARDDSLAESIYNWADFFEECRLQLQDAGYRQLREGLGDVLNVRVHGLITIGLSCSYGVIAGLMD